VNPGVTRVLEEPIMPAQSTLRHTGVGMVALASLLAVLLAPAADLSQKFGGDDQPDRTVSAQERQEVIDGVLKGAEDQKILCERGVSDM
jgi:hypothetical protein